MNEPSQGRLLILDDEEDMLRLLKRSLSTDLDCEIFTASDAYQALALLQETRFDVALADIRMPGMDGMEFLERIRKDFPELSMVMMTAYASIDLAVQAIKNGAYDFITKPFEHDKLAHLLQKALERSRLVRENLLLQKKIQEQESFQEMVGSSAKMLKVFQTIGIIAKTDVTVLITGESGTGKDLAARAIHKLSQRAHGPFVAVNCPNLPENILESELFGTRKARSHTPRKTGKASSGKRKGERCIWTKLATFRLRSRPNCSRAPGQRDPATWPEQKRKGGRAYYCLHKS